MPLTENPFTGDPEKAEVFELGYVAGFQDPSSDPFAPFSPELLDVFIQGVDAGREDAIQSSPSDPSLRWVAKSELGEDPGEEALEHLIIEGIAEIASHLFRRADGGGGGVGGRPRVLRPVGPTRSA